MGNNNVVTHRYRAALRALCTVILVAAGLFLALGFWLTFSATNPDVFGRYSRRWFVVAVFASVVILWVTVLCVRAVWSSPRTDESMAGALSPSRRLLFGGASTLMLCLAAELFLRCIGLPADLSPPIPIVDSAQHFHSSLQHVDRVKTDGQWIRAHRGGIHTHDKNTQFRVLCLGASTTYGYLLEADETWPAMLEQRLVDDGYDVEVINAGVSWQTSAQGLISYVLDGRFFQPDIVIAMYATSDLARSFPLPGEPPFERDYGSYQGPMRLMFLERSGAESDKSPMAWLRFETSALYRLARQVTRIDLMYYRSLREGLNNAIEPAAVDVPPTVDVALDGFPSIRSHRENLAYLVRLCEADGHRIILATEPNLFDCADAADQPIDLHDALGAIVSRHSLAAAMEVCRQSLFDIARETGAVVVDAERAVGKVVEHFIDGVHFTPEGNRLVADAFLPHVAGILDELTSARHALATPHGP